MKTLIQRWWVAVLLLPMAACGGSLSSPTTPTPPPVPPGSSLRLPLKASSNSRYLVDQNGSPTLVVGDAAHDLFVNLDSSGLTTYLADRKSRGFNALWVESLCDDYVANCRADMSTFDGIRPFTSGTDKSNYDISTPNPDYWSRVDSFINKAESYGMTIFLDTWETGALMPLARSNGNSKMHDFGVFLGNRYKDVPNLVWITGNDFQTWRNSTDNALAQSLMAGIASADTHHLQTTELDYHASGSLDNPLLTPLTGLSSVFDYYCSYGQTMSQYNQAKPVPVYFLEGYYEFNNWILGNVTTAANLRTQAWWAALAGSTAGQFYGSERVYTFDSGWQTYLGTDGTVQFGYLQTLLHSIKWYNLIPDLNHAVVTSGYGSFDSGSNNDCINSNTYVATSYLADGSASASYTPKSAALSVDLSRFSAPVTAKWFDPSSGQSTTITGSPFSNSGSQNFTTPGANAAGDPDWVLLLTTLP